MKTKKSDISINFLQLILTVVAIIFFLVAASLWNHFRIEGKLANIEGHVDRVYLAHQEEFVDAVAQNNRYTYTTFLNKVNAPEKGIYIIGIIVRDSDGIYHVENSYSEVSLNDTDVQRLNKILSNEKSVSTAEDFKFETYSNGNYLYAFTPIKDNGTLVGYVVLGVRKNQNL